MGEFAPEDSEPNFPERFGRFWQLPQLPSLDSASREWIFFVEALGAAPQLIWIGKAQNLKWRLVELQSMNPMQLKLLGAAMGPPGTCHIVRALFAKDRRHSSWFELSSSMLEFIRLLPRGDVIPTKIVRIWADLAGLDLQEITQRARERSTARESRRARPKRSAALA